MCIAVIVVGFSERFPLIVVHSRDEDVSRPTSALEVRDNILAATDLKAGGVAAVGLNCNTGRFAVLTNCRQKYQPVTTAYSRGSLIKEVLLHGFSSDVIDIVNTKHFQGQFHLYSGIACNGDTIIQYLSNTGVGGIIRPTKIADEKGMHVIVRMNEHPSEPCLSDWRVKLEWMQAEVTSGLKGLNREITSVEGIVEALEKVFSRFAPITTDPLEAKCEWSPFPDIERNALLRQIVVPPIDLGNGVMFGTVSQTMMIVDSHGKNIHYMYRTVEEEMSTPPGVRFSIWDTRVIECPSTSTE